MAGLAGLAAQVANVGPMAGPMEAPIGLGLQMSISGLQSAIAGRAGATYARLISIIIGSEDRIPHYYRL